MVEQGTVSILNARSGWFGVELSDGQFVLAELLGNEQLRVGETIAGEMRSVGEALLQRADTGETLATFIRAYEISRQAAEFEIV